jgi:hypothetical protein
MAEPTLYERLGGIFAIVAVDNFSDRLSVMAISRPVSAVPGRHIRVRYLTVSGWWPR